MSNEKNLLEKVERQLEILEKEYSKKYNDLLILKDRIDSFVRIKLNIEDENRLNIFLNKHKPPVLFLDDEEIVEKE